MSYNDEISAAVLDWMHRERLDSARAGAAVGLNRPTFAAKLRGDRSWKTSELPILARAGVELPDPEGAAL